jgi:hypothetical protein
MTAIFDYLITGFFILSGIRPLKPSEGDGRDIDRAFADMIKWGWEYNASTCFLMLVQEDGNP